MVDNDIRHFGEYEGDVCLFFGYNNAKGNVLALRLSDVNDGEEADLLLNLVVKNYNDKTLAEAAMRTNDIYSRNSVTQFYSQKRSNFSQQGGALVPVPAHFIKMYDAHQAESWFTNNSVYSLMKKEHKFLERVREALNTNQPVPELPVSETVQSTSGQTDVVTGDEAVRFLQENGLAEHYTQFINAQTNATEPVTEPVSETQDGLAQKEGPVEPSNDVLAAISKLSDQVSELAGQVK